MGGPAGTREDRAALARLVADRDHPVPGLAQELRDALAAVAADVDAHARHHRDRCGADAGDLGTRTGDLKTVAGPCAEHALGHLRPGRVVGTDEQGSLLLHDHESTAGSTTAS